MGKGWFVGIILGLLLIGSPLRADFSGYYAFPYNIPPFAPVSYQPGFANGPQTIIANNWTIFSDALGELGPDGQRLLSANDNFLLIDPGFTGNSLDYFSVIELTTIAPEAGIFSFDFSLNLGTPSVSQAYYMINGTHFMLPAGTASVHDIALNAGDVFGFGTRIGRSSIVEQQLPMAELSVTNFSGPVPEPSTDVLIFLGAFICIPVVVKRLKSGLTSE